MAYDIHIHIDSQSLEGHVVESIISRDHVSPEEAVLRALRHPALAKPTPVDEMWEAFSSPKDSASMDEAMESVRELRGDHSARRGPRPPLRTDDAQTAIGMFAGKEGFQESVDTVIASRAQRYGSPR